MEETKIYTSLRAFRKGLQEVKVKDLPKVRKELMEALGVTSGASLSRYARGLNATLDIEKAKKIEAIFAEYGIENCWGN